MKRVPFAQNKVVSGAASLLYAAHRAFGAPASRAGRAPGQSVEAFYMGLMDRVRAQATQLAQQAQEAAQEGRSRLDQAQAGRRGDMLLRQLGALVFAERTGRGTPDSQARIDQLINDISAHERENGLNLADPPQQGFAQSVLGQSVWGQASSGQPPAGQGAQAPAGFDQSVSGQAQPGQQAGFPASAQDAPGQAGPGQAETAQPPSPPGGAGGMPSVDTTTSFFPAPDGEAPGAPPQS